jgi:hypothetical protein
VYPQYALSTADGFMAKSWPRALPSSRFSSSAPLIHTVINGTNGTTRQFQEVSWNVYGEDSLGECSMLHHQCLVVGCVFGLPR